MPALTASLQPSIGSTRQEKQIKAFKLKKIKKLMYLFGENIISYAEKQQDSTHTKKLLN